VSRRGRLWFVAVCLAVFALLAVVMTWLAPSTAPNGKTPVTVTLAPGAQQPAGLTVSDLDSVDQLRARFNADTGVPRLVLSLAPT